MSLSWSYIDWSLLIGYFILITFWDFTFGLKKNRRIFLGRGKVPVIVSALSIYATLLSSISYIVIPAAIYNDGWVVGLSPIGGAIFLILVAKFIVPKFYSMTIKSAYDFLEYRFGYYFKVIASLFFVIYSIIRLTIVIFLPALSFQLILPEIPIVLILILPHYFVYFIVALLVL